MNRICKGNIRLLSLITSFVMFALCVIFPITETSTVKAADPAYMSWRQTDSRWSGIKLCSGEKNTVGDIGCVATSICVQLAHSGVCSQDESVFNPKIGITALLNGGAFSSSGNIYWDKVSNVYPEFKHIGQKKFSVTSNKDKIKEIKKYYDEGYYILVKVEYGSSHWVSIISYSNDRFRITDTGGKNYKHLDEYTISDQIRLYSAKKKIKKEYNPGSISGNYYLKNNSTGTYAYMNGKDEKKTDIALGEKKETDAFKMKFTPVNTKDAQQGDVVNPFAAKNCVVNAYSDTPVDGTDVNLWTKTSNASQHWVFDKVDSGYVIRSRYDDSLVLTAVSGTVKVKTYSSGNKAQIWTLESIPNPLSSISVSAPTKKEYYIGDKIDTSGMKVTAKYEDGSTKDVTSSVKVEASLAETGEKEVTVSYTENSVTKTAKFTVTVKEVPEYFKGKGTADDPYLIEKAEDLVKFRDVINDTSLNAKFAYSYYKQTLDIDLEKQEWIPIGIGIKEGTTSNDYNRMFHGVYDGGNHYIHNLKVTGDYMAAGLFGFTDGKYKENQGVVRNVVVDGVVNVPGSVNSGGIVGQMMSGSVIENCGFIGDVTGGAFEGSTFDAAGGITGCLYATGSIKNCYHTGNVTSKNCAAGIAGMIRFYKDNSGLKGSIENCYQANGKITSDGESGAITAKEMETGTDNKSSVVNCFADSVCGANIEADKVDINTGMLVETSKIKKIAEDLGDAFADGTADLNNGYPVLKWEVSSGIDLNADGKLDSQDVVILQNYFFGTVNEDDMDIKSADLNKNGRVDILDICLLKNKLLQ